jgi:hypothetical protein
MERLFLEHTFRWLVMEGVLVLVIPFERLHECVGILASHFARLNIFRMTDEESVRFRQIVVLGIRRNVRGVAVEEARRQLQRISPYRSFQALPELAPEVCEPYSVPSTGEAALSYRGLPYDLLEDLLPLSGAWKQTLPFLMPREDVATGRPITPLHGGHVGLLCTAGLLNGVFGQGDDPKRPHGICEVELHKGRIVYEGIRLRWPQMVDHFSLIGTNPYSPARPPETQRTQSSRVHELNELE